MSENINLLTAFGAGLMSFLSPCVMPLLPTYTAFLAGSGAKQEQSGGGHLLLNSLLFMSGFTTVFVAMGVTVSYLGRLFFEYHESIRQFGGVFMILMGVHLTGLIQLPLLQREYRPLLTHTFQGPLSAFVLGVAFTVGWTPCTGPILGAILAYAGGSMTVSQGAFLLLVYAAGFCIPFFIIAFLIHYYIFRMQTLFRMVPVIQRAAGVVLIVTGVFYYLNWLQ